MLKTTNVIPDDEMRKTINDLLAQADSTVEDNTTGLISASDVRSMFKDIIDTLSPGYGIASALSVTLAALSTAPVKVTYTDQLAATAGYLVDPALGTITRQAQGLPSTVNRVSFYADVAAATGAEIVFSLFRDGIDIPGGTTCSGQGIGNFVQGAFSLATTAEDGADHVYEVRAAKITGAADNVDLSNVRFIMELIPTIGI